MKIFKYALLVTFISACSTTPSHVGKAQKNDDGSEFSIKDTNNGFIVAAHYSEYQFVRNSKSGFIGCMEVLNSAAETHAEKKNKSVAYPKWNEIEIVDHGRDLLTAIMNVNCKYQYKYQALNTNIASELEKLKSLKDSGALTEQEYDAAKQKLLGL